MTAIQRCSGDLRRNPHLHAVFLDGVYVEQVDHSPGRQPPLNFAQLQELTDMDVKEVLQTLVARAARYLRRRGMLAGAEWSAANDQAADPDGQQLAVVAVRGGPQAPRAARLFAPSVTGRPVP